MKQSYFRDENVTSVNMLCSPIILTWIAVIKFDSGDQIKRLQFVALICCQKTAIAVRAKSFARFRLKAMWYDDVMIHVTLRNPWLG